MDLDQTIPVEAPVTKTVFAFMIAFFYGAKLVQVGRGGFCETFKDVW
jgi:hypothetical protein